jgi:hypothetical protein
MPAVDAVLTGQVKSRVTDQITISDKAAASPIAHTCLYDLFEA